MPGVDREAVQRRTLRVLFAAQVLSGAGLGAGVSVGALLAEDMIGGTGFAGVPAALFTGGSALAAYVVGVVSQRAGRRPGLALGLAAGALGGAGTVAAAAIDSVPLLLVCLFLYGSGTATNLQARYAGADLAHPDRRATAISLVLVGTTVGAVVGPNLVDVMGGLARDLGIRELAGPFILSSAAYACGAVIVAVFLRPDPLLLARAEHLTEITGADGVAPAADVVHDPRTVRLAATVMVVSQMVMLAIMTMTPVHMREHGQSLSAAGLVISLHIAAMFLPSPITGRLVDRVGRRPLIAAGAMALCAAGMVAAIAPAESLPAVAVALMLLGLGWNLGVVGGTALLTDAVPLARRARTQGGADVALALAGATGGLGSGVVVAGTSFAALSVLGGAVGLALLPLLLAVRRHPARDSAAGDREPLVHVGDQD
ncbi:MAG: MFS transporter [Thermoleophilia bacterium]|nr:MFS transporter [Thermoleophilia bacterium]